MKFSRERISFEAAAENLDSPLPLEKSPPSQFEKSFKFRGGRTGYRENHGLEISDFQVGILYRDEGRKENF